MMVSGNQWTQEDKNTLEEMWGSDEICTWKSCNTCKYCNTELFPVLDLGVQPFSNTLISMKDYYNEEKYFVLNFSKCPKCKLKKNINPKEIFDENYPYFSSVSQSWLDHCEKYTNKIIYDYNLTRKSVIELASNDGYLLNFLKNLI